ncbi:MAG: hypothetical protein R2706_12110 [Acidimicrobiales bacterium]
MSVAVIDLGTVTARLLILTPEGKRLTDRRFTRLGENLGQSGVLSAASLERVAEALDAFAAQIADANVGPESTFVVGTSAARDAANTHELAQLVSDRVGVPLEVLSGDDEGRYAFQGATRSHGHDGQYAMTLDIGGGSTEFVVGVVGGESIESYSADTGASRITDAYIVSDPPEPEDLSAGLSIVELHVIDARRAVANLAVVAESGPVIGLGARSRPPPLSTSA